MKARTTGTLRRAEITLWFVGICLLGAALFVSVDRWQFQAKQEQALFGGGPAFSVPQQPSDDLLAPDPQAVSPAPEQLWLEEATPKVAEAEEPLAPAAVEPGTQAPEPVRRKVVSDAAPAAYAKIEIPRVGLAAIVSEGDDDATLSRAVGLVTGSPRPGESGNVVLAGHRDTFFRPLRKIQVNDQIRVTVPPHTYEYRVESVRIVAPEETSVLQSRGVEELTLVTCYPFRFVGPAPDRFIVQALRVE
ncbi:MAG TPA: class D sortase [Thermoanaerobaculia bacterium]